MGLVNSVDVRSVFTILKRFVTDRLTIDRDGIAEYVERFAQAERNILRGLEDQGVVDVFRRVNGYGDLDIRDTSHKTRRFDHIIASSSLNPTDCYYEPNELDCSDHAPIIGEFEVGH